VNRTLKRPAVSVIIPSSDRAGLLGRALTSIRRQTFADFEVIVVDDGSAEPVEWTIAAAERQGIQILRHTRRRGASAARNIGLRASRGELVAFLDDDDEWLPVKLERQLAAMDSLAAVDLIYSGYEVVSDLSHRVVDRYVPAGPPVGYADLLRSTCFPTSVPLIRRSALVDVGGFDESLRGAQDRDLWLRLARRSRFAFVPEVLVRTHLHGAQISTDLLAKLDAKERMLRKYGPDLESEPAIYAGQLVRLAMLNFAVGRRRRARQHLRRCMRVQPLQGAPYLHLWASLIAPGAHRRLVRRRAFRRLDGVSLYW
jgi:glycosyltransferase involved in cell wall biosynthesis